MAFLVGSCTSCTRELLSNISENRACMAGSAPADFRVFVFQSQLGKLKSPPMIMAAFRMEQPL